MATTSSNIESHDTSDYSYYALTNPTRGHADSTSTDYASMNLTRGQSAQSYMYWEFSLPAIPTNATIDSITCNYKARVSSSSTNYIAQATIQLYSGTTAKGSSKSIRTTSTSASSLSSDQIGTWTPAEINAGMRLRTWAQRGGSRTTSNYYIYFYGADIEIEYTEASGDKVFIKSNGSWVEVAKAYKKVNGAWVEQTDLSTLFSEGSVIIKGN